MRAEDTPTPLQRQLFALGDAGYRDFQSALMPGIAKETVIGVRVPALRKFAGEFAKTGGARAVEAFLAELPHAYYEENNLHMLLVTAIPDYGTCLAEIKKFLPYVDNWATCDFPAPKCFAAHREELLPEIRKWLASGAPYTVRYGIGLLMRLYLDADFSPEYPALVADICSDEYYVNMMVAWYFATALAKQWESVLPYLTKRRLPPWTHKKTIQKAIESYRISQEQKEFLRGLR